MLKTVDIVIPVYNEEKVIEKSILVLLNCIKELKEYEIKIIIADNGSTDNTQSIAKKLSQEHGAVELLRVEQKGRGRALKKAWMESNADIVSYMDVDLSTSLSSLKTLLDSVRNKYSVATGSRLLRTSKVQRSFSRGFLSKGYNFLLKLILSISISDAQCGFKAAKTNVAKELIPRTKDNNWFFDTELLILAERNNHKIKEIPIEWKEDKDSKVKLCSTIYDYIKNILRIKFNK